jgi:hypothetical protein
MAMAQGEELAVTDAGYVSACISCRFTGFISKLRNSLALDGKRMTATVHDHPGIPQIENHDNKIKQARNRQL